MHFFPVIIAAILVSCHATPTLIETKQLEQITTYGLLDGFLEKLKGILKTGDTKLGIPKLDPLSIEHVDVNTKGLIELKGSLDSIRGHGLSEYTVNQGDFTFAGFLANISLTWNELEVMTKYKLDNSTLADTLSIFGEGIISARVNNLTAHVEAKVGITEDQRVYIANLTLHVHLKRLDIIITGLLNDTEFSKLVSNILSELTPQMVDDYQQQLSKYASPLVMERLNNNLKGMTLDKLIDIINGSS
ncbi:uncharacterized protein LOC143147279 [Ptiloglossa arizonensis]|uniref:uncharacterized protein LOC143147279 n=1 Tax=Ptiloglossa arizonensis TaxID=3350558 RepID=UPI003FA0400B